MAVTVLTGAGVATTALVPAKVTAPFRARSASNVPPVPDTEMDVKATTVPKKVLVAPKVADVPICQKTLPACAPLVRATTAEAAVVKVVAIWNTNLALGFPPALSVRVPVAKAAEEV